MIRLPYHKSTCDMICISHFSPFVIFNSTLTLPLPLVTSSLIPIGAGDMPMFILMTEFVGKRYRHIAGNAFWFAWVASLLNIVGLAYFIRDWRTLTIVTGVLGMAGIFTWW